MTFPGSILLDELWYFRPELLILRPHSQASAPLLPTPQHVVRHSVPTLPLVVLGLHLQSSCLGEQQSLGAQATVTVRHWTWQVMFCLWVKPGTCYPLQIQECPLSSASFSAVKKLSSRPWPGQTLMKVLPRTSPSLLQQESQPGSRPEGQKGAPQRLGHPRVAAELTYGTAQSSRRTRPRSLGPRHTATC